MALFVQERTDTMPRRLSRFEMPRRVVKDEATATGTYAMFTAEPFEVGYARTIGNSLRRVLLSSIEGAAITSVNITGAADTTLQTAVDGIVDLLAGV